MYSSFRRFAYIVYAMYSSCHCFAYIVYAMYASCRCFTYTEYAMYASCHCFAYTEYAMYSSCCYAHGRRVHGIAKLLMFWMTFSGNRWRCNKKSCQIRNIVL